MSPYRAKIVHAAVGKVGGASSTDRVAAAADFYYRDDPVYITAAAFHNLQSYTRI